MCFCKPAVYTGRPLRFRFKFYSPCAAFSNSAACFPIITQDAMVLPEVTRGTTDPSASRRRIEQDRHRRPRLAARWAGRSKATRPWRSVLAFEMSG
jgi:hypothetical protein